VSIRRALSLLLIRLAQRLDPMLVAARQQSMSGSTDGRAGVAGMRPVGEPRGATRTGELRAGIESGPLTNIEFVDALKREAREQHGPKLTAYTRRLKALR
jgi:hypothetical protein